MYLFHDVSVKTEQYIGSRRQIFTSTRPTTPPTLPLPPSFLVMLRKKNGRSSQSNIPETKTAKFALQKKKTFEYFHSSGQDSLIATQFLYPDLTEIGFAMRSREREREGEGGCR